MAAVSARSGFPHLPLVDKLQQAANGLLTGCNESLLGAGRIWPAESPEMEDVGARNSPLRACQSVSTVPHSHGEWSDFRYSSSGDGSSWYQGHHHLQAR